jgi:hypothetical protein
MPYLLTWSIGIILIFIQVREHFIDALNNPAEPLFSDVLGDQFFH